MNTTRAAQHRIDGATTASTPGGCADEAAQFEEMGLSESLSFFDVKALFPDEAAAEAGFRDQRWPDGVRCVACLSPNVAVQPTRRPQPFRCRDCRKDFSVRTGTLMHPSKLPVRVWVIAMWMMSERTKGISSHQMAREPGITQKTAWHLGHRIRKAFSATVEGLRFAGPVEVDETQLQSRRAPVRDWATRGFAPRCGFVGVVGW